MEAGGARDHGAGTATLVRLLGPDRSLHTSCESWLESECLRILADAGLPGPEVQRVVRDGRGRALRADFGFVGGRLVVEVSGHATHATRRQRQIDAERRAELAALGVVHVEFTYEDVTERPSHVVRRVEQMLTVVEHPTQEVPAQNAPGGHILPEAWVGREGG